MSVQQRLGRRSYLIVAGSRSITDRRTVERCLDSHINRTPRPHLLSGTADGVDTIVGEIAEEYDLDHDQYEAEWSQYGKAAGPKRNREMAADADELVAVWDGSSRGTESMIEIALSAGLDLHVYQPEG